MGEWISIKDQLPAEGQLVIISTLTGVTAGRLVDDAGHRFWSWDKFDFVIINMHEVLHWMPLPALQD